MLRRRNDESKMKDLDTIPVPEKPRLLYGMLPEHLGRKGLQHLQENTSIEQPEIQIRIEAQEVALLLAALTREPWYGALVAAVMKTATVRDPSAAVQTMKLGYLWWFRAREFGAGPREGVLAAKHTLDMHAAKGKVWPGELRHVLSIPRLDVPLSYEPTSNTDEAWIAPRALSRECWVNPVAAEVGAVNPLLLASSADFPPLLSTAGHVVAGSEHEIQTTEQAVDTQVVAQATASVNKGPDRAARPADPGSSKKQKPGKHQRQRAREAAAAVASASVPSTPLQIQDTPPYGDYLNELDLQLTGPRASSPSSTGSGSTSSSSSGGTSSATTSTSSSSGMPSKQPSRPKPSAGDTLFSTALPIYHSVPRVQPTPVQAAAPLFAAVGQNSPLAGIPRPRSPKHVRFADLFSQPASNEADAGSARARPFGTSATDADSARARPYVAPLFGARGPTNVFANENTPAGMSAASAVSASIPSYAPAPASVPMPTMPPEINASDVHAAGPSVHRQYDAALVQQINDIVLRHAPYLQATARWFRDGAGLDSQPTCLEGLNTAGLRELRRRLQPLMDGLTPAFIDGEAPPTTQHSPAVTVSPQVHAVTQPAMGMPSGIANMPYQQHFPVLGGQSQAAPLHFQHEQVPQEGRGNGGRIKTPPIPTFSRDQAS